MQVPTQHSTSAEQAFPVATQQAPAPLQPPPQQSPDELQAAPFARQMSLGTGRPQCSLAVPCCRQRDPGQQPLPGSPPPEQRSPGRRQVCETGDASRHLMAQTPEQHCEADVQS